jgi:hypothetical protein
MAGELQVDINALEALSHRLLQIEHKLGSLGRDLSAFDAVIGARQVREQLAELAGNWDHVRRRLMNELRELGTMAQSAANQYRATEAELASSSRERRRARAGPQSDRLVSLGRRRPDAGRSWRAG